MVLVVLLTGGVSLTSGQSQSQLHRWSHNIHDEEIQGHQERADHQYGRCPPVSRSELRRTASQPPRGHDRCSRRLLRRFCVHATGIHPPLYK